MKVLRDGFNDIEYDEKKTVSMDTAKEISKLVKEDLGLSEDEVLVAVTPPNNVFIAEVNRQNDTE